MMSNILNEQYSAIDTSRDMRAIVVSRVDPRMQGRIAVVIPSIMPGVDPIKPAMQKGKVSIEHDGLENKEISAGVSGDIGTSNYIWARPTMSFSGNSRVPYEGSTVYVFFEDGDPSKVYYRPYAPTLSGDATDMETIGATTDQFTPANKPNIHVIDTFEDGTVLFYNENTGTREYGIKMKDGTTFSINNGENKAITLNTAGGFKLDINQTAQSINLSTPGGNIVDLNDGGGTISLTNSGGAKITLEGGNVSIN